ncbi:phosphotransferase [Bradymonas sediminis]|uniref:Uncharacterized protein n=1 Tax=Bradymonas sediminis TaxID=1548548 RepID=A0A2Z4FQB2_9DELT|nr:phosphotransferase [Bradymonas sediminis]AWV91143.1 hypothetical protein DN745_18145 [Bradymonas sediminis]TDP73702.1 choline/ethanolamine kinase [Bradymonas sediminis]
MKISELKEREDFAEITARTLARGWSRQFGRPITVSTTPIPGAQQWLLHSLLGAVYTRDSAPSLRKFVADHFRCTARPLRIVPQYIVGTLLTRRAVLNRLGQPFLWVTPAIDNSATLLVAPGNQRIRVFDFESGLTRAFLKEGFDNRSMMREIAVRTKANGSCFTQLQSWDENGKWLEEPILEGIPLTRCLPWVNSAGYLHAALRSLDVWLNETSEEVAAAQYIEQLQRELLERLHGLIARYPDEPLLARLGPLIAQMSCQASKLETIQIAHSHGDLQGGNIWVDHAQSRTLLIDWEYSARRFRYYDFLLMGLAARPIKSFGEHSREFVRGGQLREGLHHYLPAQGQAWRKGALALFLLEEFNWVLDDQEQGDYSALSANFRVLAQIFAETIELLS